jgi:hypothetical protein
LAIHLLRRYIFLSFYRFVKKILIQAGFIAEVISIVGLFLLYHPPQHPKGVPWREGLAGLDYVGALLVTPGVVLTLVGIIFTVSGPKSV